MELESSAQWLVSYKFKTKKRTKFILFGKCLTVKRSPTGQKVKKNMSKYATRGHTPARGNHFIDGFPRTDARGYKHDLELHLDKGFIFR